MIFILCSFLALGMAACGKKEAEIVDCDDHPDCPEEHYCDFLSNTCAPGTGCEIPHCDPDENRCADNNVETCDSFGCQWKLTESCEFGCKDGVCTPELLTLELLPVFGAANIDDDDEDGIMDWDNNSLELIPFDNEVIWRVIPGAERSKLVDSRLRMTLLGDTDEIRVHFDNGPFIGAGEAEQIIIEGSEEDFMFGVEFAAFLSEGKLLFELIDDDEVVYQEIELSLMGAPLILNHHLQQAERMWVVSVATFGYNNSAMINGLRSVLGNRLSIISGRRYDYDVWIQDEIEFATLTDSEGHRLDVILNSIRDGQEGPGGGLDPFAENELSGPDVAIQKWGAPYTQSSLSSQDFFGNLEVSPPVTVNGINYPYGRIYYGDSGPGLRPNEALREMLEEQRFQSPVTFEIDWLCVGHVDEYISFIPDPSSEKGFKLIYPDVDLAWQIISAMPRDTSIPRYRDFGVRNIGQIASDIILQAYNEDIQTFELNPALNEIKDAFGLEDSDIIRLPALFIEYPQCGATSLIPGFINLAVFIDEHDDIHLFAPDPFLRSSVQDQSSDPFIADIEERLPAGLHVHWLDNWDVYHMGGGQIHCGTNIMRTPVGNWWSHAEHLIGGGS